MEPDLRTAASKQWFNSANSVSRPTWLGQAAVKLFSTRVACGTRRAFVERGHIATLRQIDDQGAVSAFSCIVFDQSRPEPPRLGAHDWIALGIVIRTAAKNLGAQDAFLKLVIPARQMPFDHEPQKPGNALVACKPGTLQHPLQFPPHRPRPLKFDCRHGPRVLSLGRIVQAGV